MDEVIMNFRAIIHNSPPTSEPAWKAFVLSSWLLLGRLAVSASESNCAHYVDARLELFWIGQHSGPWYVPNVMLLQCRTPHAKQPHDVQGE